MLRASSCASARRCRPSVRRFSTFGWIALLRQALLRQVALGVHSSFAGALRTLSQLRVTLPQYSQRQCPRSLHHRESCWKCWSCHRHRHRPIRVVEVVKVVSEGKAGTGLEVVARGLEEGVKGVGCTVGVAEMAREPKEEVALAADKAAQSEIWFQQ